MNTSIQSNYTIDVKGNIIVIDCHGPFDQAIVELFSEDIKAAITQFDNKPWGSLITYYGNGIFTPDAESALKEITQYRIKHGMVAVAAIIKNSIHADLQHMQLHRIYQETPVIFHVFCGKTDAQQWLSSFLNTHTKK